MFLFKKERWIRVALMASLLVIVQMSLYHTGQSAIVQGIGLVATYIIGSRLIWGK